MKSYKQDQNKPKFIEKMYALKQQGAQNLKYQSVSVKCTKKTPDLCECQIQINCICKKPNKIPLIECRFIYLQRKHRMGKTGTIDHKELKKTSHQN